MPPSSKTIFRFSIVFALFLLGAATLRAATDWKVIKVGNRDYLSVENIARFYGFPADVAPTARLSVSTMEKTQWCSW